MLPWSKNVVESKSIPKPIPSNQFHVSERSFPFEDSVGSFIEIDKKSVTFHLQRGPVLENGVNGCQVDDIIKFCTETIRTFNSKFPSRENSIAITKLEEALLWLEGRRLDRVARNVEGKNLV